MIIKTKFCVVDVSSLAGVRRTAEGLHFIFTSGWTENNKYHVEDERNTDFDAIADTLRASGGVVLKNMVVMPGELAAVGTNEVSSLFPVFKSGARHEMKYASPEECVADYSKLEAGMSGLQMA